MKKFIRITTGHYRIVHGYDADNREITEEVRVEAPMVKLVAIDRILSVSSRYILVTGSFDRQMYWEYEESFDEIAALLSAQGLLIN